VRKILVVLFVAGIFVYGCEQKKELTESPFESQVITNDAISSNEVISLVESGQGVIEPVPSIPEEAPMGVIEPDMSVIGKPTSQQIQQALKNAGLYEGDVDGKIGPKSKKAIQDFQTQNNLKADGKVGPKTWQKLQPFLSMSAAGATTGAISN